jgi:hypothetical protein
VTDMDYRDLCSFLGEGFHTAFRKAYPDGPLSHEIWKLIARMPRDQWHAVLDFVAAPLALELGIEVPDNVPDDVRDDVRVELARKIKEMHDVLAAGEGKRGLGDFLSGLIEAYALYGDFNDNLAAMNDALEVASP